MLYGMVIDLKRCVGCTACMIACRAENFTPAGIFLTKVLKGEKGVYPAARMTFLPLQCMHCKNPPCVRVCPVGATQQREDGIVVIDQQRCIGCRYCMQACPYGMRSFLATKAEYYPGCNFTPYEVVGGEKYAVGTVAKCNLCLHRLERGLEPACVAVCPAQARRVGDLADPKSEINRLIAERGAFQLYPHFGTDPSIYYLPE